MPTSRSASLVRTLTLRKETLRMLTTVELAQIAGGAPHTTRFTNCNLCRITEGSCYATCTC